MSKFSISFRFDSAEPGDQSEADFLLKSSQIRIALWEYDNYLRSKIKYADLPEEVQSAYEDARKEFNELLNNINVSYQD